MSRYLDLRAFLRGSAPDHPLFRPESWASLDPGLAWENQDGLYTPSPAREARLRVHAISGSGRLKQRFLRTSEDSGFGPSNFQIPWAQLVVAVWRVSLNVHSYFTARVSLGKSNGVPVGAFPEGSQGTGFMLYQGNQWNAQAIGIAHNGGPQISGHENVFQALPTVPGLDYYQNVYTLTAVSFGDGAVEWLVNDTSVGYVANGAPLGYLTDPAYPGYGVRVEITNDDSGDDPDYTNFTELAFHGAWVYVGSL